MTGSLVALAAALIAFVGSHFLLSWPPLRGRLVSALGERGFLAFYSLVAAVFLVWVVAAYRAAPLELVWAPPRWTRHLAFALMPIAFMLAVVGLVSRNPTAVQGDRAGFATAGAITTITRHPFLAGVALWSIAHLIANGDAAGMLLFGAMGILAAGGMAAIDHKRALTHGAAWHGFAARTSALPFAAALAGRTRIDWRGIGWTRPLAGLALFAVVFALHGWLFNRPLVGT